MGVHLYLKSKTEVGFGDAHRIEWSTRLVEVLRYGKKRTDSGGALGLAPSGLGAW